MFNRGFRNNEDSRDEFSVRKMKLWDNDSSAFVVLLVLSAALIYFTPPTISRVAYLGFLYFAYRSGRDYLWLAFLFVLYDSPNYFYFGGLASDPNRVPIYQYARGLSLTFQDLLIMVLVYKAVRIGKQGEVIYARELRAFLVFMAIVFLYSFLFGVGFKDVALTVRYLIPLSLLFYLPRLLPKRSDWISLMKLLMPIVLFALVGQLYYITTATPLAALVDHSILSKVNSNFVASMNVGLSRFYTAPFIGLVVFIGTMYLLSYRDHEIPPVYLLTVMLAAAAQALLSATRGYIIAYLFMLMLWLLLQKGSDKQKYIAVSLLLLVGLGLYLSSNPVFMRQSERSFARLETVEYLLKGDPTADGTLMRLTVRTPRVLAAFQESPIIGLGFSGEFYQHADDHVAYPNLLLNFGIVGFVVFNLLLFTMVFKMYGFRADDLTGSQLYHRIFLIGFLGLLIIHSSSRQIFGVPVPSYVSFMVVIFFSFWNAIISDEFNQRVDELESNEAV